MADYPDFAAAADAALAAPIDLSDPRWQYDPGDPAAAKQLLSARASSADSAWIIAEAVARGTTLSAIASELIAEAVAARRAASDRT